MQNILDSLQSFGHLKDTKTGEQKKLRDFRFKYIGLYFTATWCSYCVQIVNKLPGIIQKVNSKGQFLKLITLRLDDSPTNFAYSYLKFKSISYEGASELANLTRVMNIPSIVVYDLYGNLVTRNGLQEILKYEQKTIDQWDLKARVK